MKKKCTQALLLQFLFTLLVCTDIYAGKIKVPNPGNNNDIQPAIQAAVDGAVDGDEIILPAGTFVLNKSVVVRKFISIKGKGSTKTILYRAESVPDNTLSYDAEWEAMFRYEINDSIRSSNIIIKGIYFKSKEPSIYEGDGKSKASDMGIEMIRCLDFVITGCKFQYFGNGGVTVIHNDTKAGGLVYKNEFIHNVKGVTALGLGYGVVIYGGDHQWVTDPKFGTSNFIFIEDNLFDYHRHSIAAGGGALYVFRHNTVLNNVAAFASAIDMHEARGDMLGSGNYFSSRATEVYRNNITNTTFRNDLPGIPDGTPITPGKDISWLAETAIMPQGGEALIHHNKIKGYRFGVGLITRQFNLNPPTEYPVPYQQGYLSGVQYGINHTGVNDGRGDGDIFMWKDSFDFYEPGSPYNTYFYNYSPEEYNLKVDRDYHFSKKPGYTPYVYPHPLRELLRSTETAEAAVVEEEVSFAKVFPNPTSGAFSVKLNSSTSRMCTINIHDSGGKKLQSEKVNLLKGSATREFNLKRFGKGLYIVSISDGNKTSVTKVVVQ